MALRTALLADDTDCSLIETEDGQLIAWQGRNELGDFRAELHGEETGLEQFSSTKLSFPLEDLYPDGQPAGQFGQKIYVAGAPMVFATRAFHRIEEAPFVMLGDHFLPAVTRLDTIHVRIDGVNRHGLCTGSSLPTTSEAIVRTLLVSD